MTHRQERRRELSFQENCRFVEPHEFLVHATSRLPLQRADELEAGIHGLLDPRTGMRLFVEEEKLFSHSAAGR